MSSLENLQKNIIKQRSDEQHVLKNKNGNSHSALRGYQADIEYIKKQAGSGPKGLMKVRIEHQLYKSYLQKQQEEGNELSIKQQMIIDVTNEYLDKLRVIDPVIAENHLHNLTACFNFFFLKGKWEPERFLKCTGGTK